jgi:hypothetical protein
MHRLFCLLLIVPSLACGDKEESASANFPELEDGCQPLLAGHHCLFPYPSDYFREADPDMATGYRISVTGAAANITDRGMNAEFTSFYDTDGFSKIPLIVGALPGALVADGFVDILSDFSQTELPTSKTLLIHAETGAFVPHFADLDPGAFDETKRTVSLHPVVDLEERTRYIVAFQGIEHEEGGPAPAAEGFAHLRDGTSEGIAALDGVREHFESDIFGVLQDAGIERSNLQLAWDFTTGSDEEPMADILKIREMTQLWLADNDANLVIDRIVENPENKPDVWRRIEGRITVPLYLESTESGASFARDAGGIVKNNGTAEAEFLVSIPKSLRDASEMGRPLFYGHGFFGSRTELDGDLTRTISSSLKTVMIAIDWWGMSNVDIVTLVEDLSADPLHTLRFSDRLHQSMSNWIVMTSLLEDLALQPELLRPALGEGSGGGALAGDPLIDVAHGISFMGISQGHILGGVLAAILPKLDRVVLNVGGAGLSHFMFRAEAFEALLELISRHFERSIEQYAWAAGTQRVFDRIDPGHYARYILREPLEGASPRRVLMQMGVGDVAVPNFGTYLHARAIGLPAVSNEGLGLFGLPDVQSAESGFVSFDYGVDTEFYRSPTVPIEGNEVHDSVRVEPAVLDQIDRFLQPGGMVEATCEGACDPG